MNTKFLTTSLLLSCLLFLACGSDELAFPIIEQPKPYTETYLAGKPMWQMDWSYSQPRPDWQEPDASKYENWTVALVQLENALQPYASDDDLLAFFVGDELRGLASPAIIVDGDDMEKTLFLMKAYGNEPDKSSVEVTLKYYSSHLQQIFSRSAAILYQDDEVFGIDEDFIPNFTRGSSKYPVVMDVQLSDTPIVKAGITPAEGDMVAAYVGDECRGSCQLLTPNPQFSTSTLTIYGREEGEKVTLKYFDAVNVRELSFPDAVVTEQQQQTPLSFK